MVNELNSIDKCFVNDDADGITEIMKRAEENTELSNWNKLRIISEISECKLALDGLAELTKQKIPRIFSRIAQ